MSNVYSFTDIVKQVEAMGHWEDRGGRVWVNRRDVLALLNAKRVAGEHDHVNDPNPDCAGCRNAK